MRTTALLCCLLLAACSASPPPTAAAKADAVDSAIDREGARHHELKDAIQEQKKYEDRAKAAGDKALDADKAHDKQLEDSGG